MADGTVGLNPDGTGKLIDVAELFVNGKTVERQRMVIGDNIVAGNFAKVDVSGALRSAALLTDPTSGAQVSISTYHTGDGQTIAGSGNSLLTAGVGQLLDIAGLSDRQRATGTDSISALGVVAGTTQLASPFSTTASNGVNAGQGTQAAPVTITPAAMSGSNRGGPWSILVGTTLVFDLGLATQEAAYVNSVTATTASVIFGGTGARFAHALGASLNGFVYNQARDATLVDGSVGLGLSAGATYLFNGVLNAGAGGWEAERSALGELDNASGAGTAVATEYEFTGKGYDRGRNLQGKGFTGTTLNTASTVAATTVQLVTAAGITPGMQIMLEPGTANEEAIYVSSGFVPTGAANASVALQTPTAFSHGAGAVATYSRFAAGGPRLSQLNPDGIDVAEDIVYSRSANGGLGGYFVDTAADSDGISGNNVPEESIGLVRPDGLLDRMSGSAVGTSVAAGKTLQAIQGAKGGVPMAIQAGGATTTAVASNTAAAIKASSGQLGRVLVTAAGTAAQFIYDSPSAASGTLIGVIPANAASGSVIAFDMPAALGIFTPATASGPAFTVAFF